MYTMEHCWQVTDAMVREVMLLDGDDDQRANPKYSAWVERYVEGMSRTARVAFLQGRGYRYSTHLGRWVEEVKREAFTNTGGGDRGGAVAAAGGGDGGGAGRG